MKIETLKNYFGLTDITSSDFKSALNRMHEDHRMSMVAIKLLTESVQSTAAGNLDMTVVHEERHKDITKTLRELKKDVTTADSRHLAAFELALRPMIRAVEEMDKRLTNKLNNIDADLHAMRVDRNYELDAHTSVLNTKLNAIAERIDSLVKILAKDLIKHPEGVTLAPPKSGRGGRQPGAGRKPGSKPRPPEVRYADLSNKLQRCRSPKARAKYLFKLTALRRKMGMAPIKGAAQ